MSDAFWAVVVGTLTLLVSFWAAHVSNVERIERKSRDWQDMRTKLDLIYEWFCENVVGRGEPPRGAGSD